MSVPIENQIEFYDWQLREMDLSWAKYHGAKVLDLYKANQLFIGRIWGFDEKRGVLILRFKQGKFPRLKVPLTLSYPKANVGALSQWDFKYGKFREYYVEQYTNCTPIFFLENKEAEIYRYVGFKNVSIEFLVHIKKDLIDGTHAVIVLGAEDPPRDYLVALRNFTQKNQTHAILNLSLENLMEWRPKNLSDLDKLVSDTLEVISANESTILQGPPGTGKTYLIAELCNHFLDLNYRVCITALTHKALMEAAVKEGLNDKCRSKKVFKSNLSADESALIPELQNHNPTEPVPEGHLLLVTYYSLSKLLMLDVHKDRFDILIIEEASQAFLTTLAGFSSLCKKVLIVGDFMQLQPIVLEEKRAINIHKDISLLINGLKTYSFNNINNSYRLVNSFRLSIRSAEQTGVFYNNSLESRSKEKGISLSGKYSGLFCPEGGTSLMYMDNMDEGKAPENAVMFIIEIVVALKKEHPSKKIAVLSAFKDTVKLLIDKMLHLRINFNNLEVNTVDRIQGMTVDICIYLAPSYKTKFSFNDNRFNVATSRAKNGTLIIAEDLISNRKLLSNQVMFFLDSTYKSSLVP